MLGEKGRTLDAILFFDLCGRHRDRADARAGDDEGRPDDSPEAIARRLELYHEQTAPVVEQYRTTGKVVPLHAERPIGEVTARSRRRCELLDEAVAA